MESYALQVLKVPSTRDKQKLVGASNISRQCDRCLVDDLLGVERLLMERPFWLGARLGTAIHESLETHALPGVQTELRVTIGEIPGYGVVKSTTDLYIPDARKVIDFKTTTRDKLKKYKKGLAGGDVDESTQFTLLSYINQIQLYGWGLMKAGKEVETVGIDFICRDGTGDQDIWSWEMDYNEEIAAEAWDRVVRLWNELQDGAEPNSYEWAVGCYYCSRERS